jgi:hypothetical protein
MDAEPPHQPTGPAPRPAVKHDTEAAIFGRSRPPPLSAPQPFPLAGPPRTSRGEPSLHQLCWCGWLQVKRKPSIPGRCRQFLTIFSRSGLVSGNARGSGIYPDAGAPPEPDPLVEKSLALPTGVEQLAQDGDGGARHQDIRPVVQLAGELVDDWIAAVSRR